MQNHVLKYWIQILNNNAPLSRRSILQYFTGSLSFLIAGIPSSSALAAGARKLSLEELTQALLRSSNVKLGAGAFELTGSNSIAVGDKIFDLRGDGMDKTHLDARTIAGLRNIFTLESGSQLSLSDLTISGGKTGIWVEPAPGVDNPAAEDLLRHRSAKLLRLENMRFQDMAAVVTMQNGGYGRRAMGGIEEIYLTNCNAENVHRGFIFGDIGAYKIRRAEFRDINIERAGRFGLMVGSTFRAATSLTEEIIIENLISRDLVYFSGKNCAHVVVTGRNVTLRNISLIGAVLDKPEAGKESDKEALYLQCRDAVLENIEIIDTLALQGALVLKGAKIGSDTDWPEGGNYTIRDLRVEQTSNAVSDMRGVWLQTGPAHFEKAVFKGLSGPAILVNGPGFDDLTFNDVDIVDPNGKIAIVFNARTLQNVQLINSKISRPTHKNRFTGVNMVTRKGGLEVNNFLVSNCAFDLADSANDSSTTGIALNLSPEANIANFRVVDTSFACAAGIKVRGEGKSVDLEISNCDFTRVPDPAMAIIIAERPGLRKKKPTSGLSVRFSSPCPGLTLRQEGKVRFEAGVHEVEIPLAITPLSGFAHELKPEDVKFHDGSGKKRIVLKSGSVSKMILHRANANDSGDTIEISFIVEKTEWAGANA